MNSPVTTTEKIPVLGIASHGIRLDGPRARALYQWLVSRMEQMGIPPHIITLDAPGFWGAKYKDFERVRSRIETFDFSALRNLHLTHKRSDWSDQNQNNWVAKAAVSWNRNKPVFNVTQCLIGFDSGLSESEMINHLTAYAKIAVDHYGYVFTMPRQYAPQYHPVGCSGFEPFAAAEEKENAGWWALYQNLIPHQLMLRNIYPINFLTREFLNLLVHGTKLEQWIREDANRGILTTLTENIWSWEPSLQHIPMIREQLFRAGILFYYKFFQTWESDNPWKRDFGKPFLPHEPIPEIFRANYRHITDLSFNVI